MTSSNLQLGRECKIEQRSAKLSSEFGMSLLKKKVSAERFEEIMEEVVSKSALIVWTKVLEGGFDYRKGRVLRGGCVDFYVEWKVDGKTHKTSVSKQDKSGRESMQGLIPELESRLSDLKKLIKQCDTGIVQEEDLDMIQMYADNRKIYEKQKAEVEASLANIKGL